MLLGPSATVRIDLVVGTGIAVNVHIHCVHAAAIWRLVVCDDATIHRHIGISENIDTSTGKGCFTPRDFAVVENEC